MGASDGEKAGLTLDAVACFGLAGVLLVGWIFGFLWALRFFLSSQPPFFIMPKLLTPFRQDGSGGPCLPWRDALSGG
jgi:hypothetical protein